MVEVTARELAVTELGRAGGVAARALADNPLFKFLYGDNALARLLATYDQFVAFLQSSEHAQVGALLGTHVIAVAAAFPPGHCVGTMIPPEWRRFGGIGEPGSDERRQALFGTLAAHDLDERHWHVGPVGVEPGLRGLGVGGATMRELGVRLDAVGEVAWLETDKPENVVFYRRCGYDVVDETMLDDLRLWFMRRGPR